MTAAGYATGDLFHVDSSGDGDIRSPAVRAKSGPSGGRRRVSRREFLAGTAASTAALYGLSNSKQADALCLLSCPPPPPQVTNAFPNPKCTVDLSWWTSAYGSVNNGTGTIGLSRITTDGVAPGSTCAQLSFTPDASRTGIFVAGRSPSYQYPVTVNQGDIIWMRASAKIVQGTAGGSLQLWSRYENTSGQTQLLQEVDNPPIGQWISLEGFDIAAYSGTSGSGSLYVEAVIVYVNGDTSPVVVRATNVLICPNPGAYVDYFDGDGGTSVDSGSGFGWDGTSNESSSHATLPTSSTVASSFLFGLNDNSERDNGMATDWVSLHTGVGSRVRRMEFDLSDPQFVQPDGTLNWSAGLGPTYQAILTACASNGIQLLPVALGAPASMNGGITPSTNRDKIPPLAQFYGQWANACANLAAHIGTTLAAIEIWNEPNLTAFWQNGVNHTGTGSDGTSRVDSSAYTAMLQHAYSAIKTAAPSARVALGGVNGTNATGSTSDSLNDWLNAVYGAGAKGNFDVMSIHTYATDPGSGKYQDYDLRSTVAVQTANSDSKPLWITEMGWWLSPPGSLQSGAVSANQQSILTRLAYGMLKRQTNVQAVIPYRLTGIASPLSSTAPATPDDGYGWVLETKPAIGSAQYAKNPVYGNMYAEISAEKRQ